MYTHEKRKEILYQKPIPNFIQEWYNMQAPYRLNQLLSPQDIAYLNSIATSVKLSGSPSKKKELITRLMEQRGFKRLDCGTNRIVYKFMEDQSFLVKVAFDRVAISDNLREYRNQEYLRPFCAKCFEVSPCGTVGMFERVMPVKNREQFASIAYRVFDIIVNCFIGKFILADFGTEYFKNWGVRVGAFPVIVDYPYLYELDPAKITCNNKDDHSPSGFCEGEIDYEDGFNYLYCKKCGKRYLASELAKEGSDRSGFSCKMEDSIMLEITIKKSNGTVVKLGEEKKTNTYKKLTRKEYKMKKSAKNFDVVIERANRATEEVVKPEEPKVEEAKVAEEELSYVTETDKLCRQLEVTITKGNDTYVGKSSEPAYVNSYDIYGSAGYLYGEGASLVNDKKEEESETVYSSESDDVKMNNMSEVIKTIMDVNRNTADKEPEEAAVPDNVYNQKFDASEDDEDDSAYYDDKPEVCEGEVIDEKEILDEF